MDLNKILEMQKKLDIAVEGTHNVEYKDIKGRKALALVVELAEFANEISSFKYWKKNIKHNKSDILEEYADCIHFYASFLTREVKEIEFKPEVISDDVNQQFAAVFKTATNFTDGNNVDACMLEGSFNLFLGLGEVLKFDWKEVEEFYIKKNKINYERIANNY